MNDLPDLPNCSNTTVTVTNRSNTAVQTVTILFNSSYTPLGAGPGVFKDGPQEWRSGPAGLAPYAAGTLRFVVCVPELKGKVDSLGISAVPQRVLWRWFGY